MSASMIWPVAAGFHRSFRGQLFRGQLFRGFGTVALRLLPALVLLLYAQVLFAEEPASKPVLEKNSFYLTSAGFRIQVANDPAGQKALRALPAHRFVASGVGDALRYSYAEPQHCMCIFVGTPQAYDRYRKILSQELEPRAPVAPDYKTQAGVLLAGQPLRQSTRRDPTNLSDYLSTLYPHY